MVGVVQEALLPHQLRRQMPQQLQARLGIGQRQPGKTCLRAFQLRGIGRSFRGSNFSGEPGLTQPCQRRVLVANGEGQNVDAGVARQEALQRGTVGSGIDHRDQLQVTAAQHRTAVAGSGPHWHATGSGRRVARQPRQCEAEPLPRPCGGLQISGDNADMVEPLGDAHGAVSYCASRQPAGSFAASSYHSASSGCARTAVQ
jgi:hypothetical protein